MPFHLRAQRYGGQVGLGPINRLAHFQPSANHRRRLACQPKLVSQSIASEGCPPPRPRRCGEASRHSTREHLACGDGWSGRRGSNPRPTAWKAVTLPLSYSRLRARRLAGPRALATSRYGGHARQTSCCRLPVSHRRSANSVLTAAPRNARLAARHIERRGDPPHQPCLPGANSHCAGRRKVGGEGRVRTSVARRRQVYSLLRLTALPPPQEIDRAIDGFTN